MKVKRFRSYLPPISFQSPVNDEWYVICSSDGDGWVKVNRKYDWAELSKLWDKIEYSTGVKVKVVKAERKEYKVKGSKGNTYKVVNAEGVWSCSCPAHGFGRGKDCKHIIQLKNKK